MIGSSLVNFTCVMILAGLPLYSYNFIISLYLISAGFRRSARLFLMGTSATECKNRYNAKNFDQLKILVPKGQKAAISAYAAEKGMSLTAYVKSVIASDMGDWQPPDEAGDLGGKSEQNEPQN